jgi:hypothetical protein
MSLDQLIALVGVAVTILVVLGMVLLTPRGTERSSRATGPVQPDDAASRPAPRRTPART